MKKILLLLVTMVIVLGALYIFFVLFLSKSNNVNTPPTPPTGISFPTPVGTTTTSNGTSGTDRTLPVRTPAGGSVFVRDFRNDPLVEKTATNNYILRDTNSETTATFVIIYSGNDGGIIISLRKEPLHDTRIVAETALIQHLNVTREQLCNLLIFVNVARDVNTFYAGQSLGVSSCPGSQPL